MDIKQLKASLERNEGVVPPRPAVEARLLEKARGGDRAAIDALVETLSGPAYRYGRSFCRNEDDAEDVMQDVLASLVRNLDSFRGEASLSTWAWVVARNACVRMRRRRAGQPDQVESLDGEAGEAVRQVPAPDADPTARVERNELREALAGAIGQLPAAQRDILLLRDVEGLPAEQAARRLRIGVRAAKSRLHRARLALRAALAPLLAPDAPRRPAAAGCRETAHLISRHLEGEVGDGACARLEKHVAGCPDCQAACRTMRDSLSLCRRAGRERAPAPLRRRLRAALRERAAN